MSLSYWTNFQLNHERFTVSHMWEKAQQPLARIGRETLHMLSVASISVDSYGVEETHNDIVWQDLGSKSSGIQSVLGYLHRLRTEQNSISLRSLDGSWIAAINCSIILLWSEIWRKELRFTYCLCRYSAVSSKFSVCVPSLFRIGCSTRLLVPCSLPNITFVLSGAGSWGFNY